MAAVEGEGLGLGLAGLEPQGADPGVAGVVLDVAG
jgi:hypothetical protein